MNFESIDRDMSSWVLSAKKRKTRFFLTSDGLATDILSNAARFRYRDQALMAAAKAHMEPAWEGFFWSPMSVPQAMCLKEGK